MTFRTIFLRSCRLLCPRCGKSKLFAGWFRTHERCPECGLKYERDPGFFLGSIYFNYGLTALLTVIIYFTLYFTELVSSKNLLWLLGAFSVLFPMWFFRYARSLWLGMDQYLDPRED